MYVLITRLEHIMLYRFDKLVCVANLKADRGKVLLVLPAINKFTDKVWNLKNQKSNNKPQVKCSNLDVKCSRHYCPRMVSLSWWKSAVGMLNGKIKRIYTPTSEMKLVLYHINGWYDAGGMIYFTRSREHGVLFILKAE